AGVPVPIHLAVAAAALLLLSLFVVPALPESRNAGATASVSTFGDRMRVWTEPRTLLIGVIIVGAAFAEGTANNWLALAMVEDRALTEATGAAYLTIFTGAMMIGRFCGGFLVDRFGRTATLRGALVLAVAGVLLVVFLVSPVGTIAGIVLWGLGASLGYPLSVSSAADSQQNAAARVSAVAALGALAFLVGPSIVGLIGEHSSLLIAFLVVGGLIAASLAASGASRPPVVHTAHDELSVGSAAETL
ncbi:MAG: MFS transporter, partial [Rhodoglobus sp.]